MVSSDQIRALGRIVGAENIREDSDTCRVYGADALKLNYAADVVVFPGSAAEVSSIASFCNAERIPLTPRGAGTGYTGGAVPLIGGVVLALERMNRILEIDEQMLLVGDQKSGIVGQEKRSFQS